MVVEGMFGSKPHLDRGTKEKKYKGIPKYLFSIFFSLFLIPGYIKWKIRGIWVEVVGSSRNLPVLSMQLV